MVVGKFFNHLAFEKRFSNHTIIAYQNDLRSFQDFLSKEFEIDELQAVQSAMIKSWIMEMVTTGLTPRSINRKVSTLKTFFRFLKSEGVIDNNPASSIHTLKIGLRLPVYVEKEKLNSFLNLQAEDDDFVANRDKLIIDLLYSTGIRRSELIGLTNDSIDFSGKMLKVLGKGNKERLIPLTSKMLVNIEHYINHKKERFPDAEFAFIITDNGAKAYPEFIYRIVNKQLADLTSAKKSPHVLRHTFATHMLNNGANLNTLKEILGHSSLSATQVYTHNTIEQLKSIYNHAHPRAQQKKGGYNESKH